MSSVLCSVHQKLKDRCFVSYRDVGYLLLLVTCSVLHFSPAIFTGTVPSGFDAVYGFEPWNSEYTEYDVRNSLLLDDGRQFLPWKRFSARLIQQGDVPFWNPNNGTGAPFVANDQSSVFYPLKVVNYLFPGPSANMILLVFKLMLACCLSFVFFRVFDLDSGPSFIAAMVFGLGGFNTLFLYSPITNVAIFLPGLFLGIYLLSIRPSFLYMSFLAFIIGIQFLGGHIETTFHLALACALFTVYVYFTRVKQTDRYGFWSCITGAVMLGTGLAMIQLGPFLEYLQRSWILTVRDGGMWQVGSGTEWYQFLASLPMMLFPGMYGNPIGGMENYVGAFFGIRSYTEMNGGFIGVISLVLVGSSLSRVWRHHRVGFFWLLFVLGILMGYQDPIVSPYIEALPGFHVSSNSRLLLMVVWGGSVLVGLELQYLKDHRELVRKLISYLLALLGTGLFIGLGIFYGFYDRIRDQVTNRAKFLYDQDLGGSGHAHSWMYWKEQIPDYLEMAQYVFVKEMLIAISVLAVFFVVVDYLWRRSRRYHLLAIGLISLVLFADLSRVSMGYYTPMQRHEVFPDLQVMKILDSTDGKGRVLGLNRSLIPNTNLTYGFDDIRNYDAMNLQRSSEVLMETGHWDWFLNPEMYGWEITNRSLFNFLNITHIVSPDALSVEGLKAIYQNGVHIYRNKQAGPRFLMTDQWRHFENDRQILRQMREGANLQARTLLRDDVVVRSSSNQAHSTFSYDIELRRPSVNRLEISVENNKHAILTGPISYDPGWSVRINGEEGSVLRANYAFIGIKLPPGSHQVKLVYRPLYWNWFLGCSIVSGLLLLLGTCMYFFREEVFDAR